MALPRPFFPLLLAACLLTTSACANDAPADAAESQAAAPATADGAQPAVVEMLANQGVEFMGTFETPIGLTGHAGAHGQQPVAVYVSKDGKYAIIGTLINAEGEDLGAAKVDELVSAPLGAKSWQRAEASHWVRDGKPDAPRVVYTFSDPNCPFCNRFWSAARPWVDAGKVQLRHIMVGVIREDSLNKAAAILAADNPEEALLENERNFASGGIEGLAAVPQGVSARLRANQETMVELGFQGTPGIIYKDADGKVRNHGGMPQGADLERILGPR